MAAVSTGFWRFAIWFWACVFQTKVGQAFQVKLGHPFHAKVGQAFHGKLGQ